MGLITGINSVAVLIASIVSIVSFITVVVVSIHKTNNGMKCLLRAEMLQIYYKHYDEKEIRQYEYENFVYMYEAYKALRGNSFIDKIYSEIKSWTVLS